jgi:hypothetical protein
LPPSRSSARGGAKKIDHLGIFVKPGLVLCTSRNDHDIAPAADPLFAAEAELHLSLQRPDDLLIGVTVRLDMNAGPNAPLIRSSLDCRRGCGG